MEEKLTSDFIIDDHKKLFNEIIDTVRLTEDKYSDSYVYDNQINTAKDIIYNFYTNKKRWCLLFAEMQSGKSGTFFSIPYIISRNTILQKKLNIDIFDSEINVFLLTGMNEKELIEQFEMDIVQFTGKNLKKNILHNSEMRKFLSKPKNNWSINDINTIQKMKKNSLILIDESHYGSDKNQILNKFLTQVLEISPNGDNTPLLRNNIYIVSISATPMAEFINANLSEFNKEIIPLRNSNGYNGIVEMFNSKRIFKSYDLKDISTTNKFLDKILSINKVGFILCRCSKKQQENIEFLIAKRMVDIRRIDYNAWSRSNILDNKGIDDILKNKNELGTPNKKTIIFLKGLLRAGKRVDTTNVIMIHDTSESKVDTTVQSLLGRCCGYNKNTDIDIYCDLESADKYKRWIESGYDLKMVPDKAKNVLSNGSTYKIDSICDPIIFDVSNNKYILSTMNNRKSKVDRINILKSLNNEYINSIINSGSLGNSYTIGSIFKVNKNKENTSYKKQYLDVINNKIFMGDIKANEENTGMIVFSGAYEEVDKTMVVSFGKVIKSEVSTNDKTMYHESNVI